MPIWFVPAVIAAVAVAIKVGEEILSDDSGSSSQSSNVQEIQRIKREKSKSLRASAKQSVQALISSSSVLRLVPQDQVDLYVEAIRLAEDVSRAHDPQILSLLNKTTLPEEAALEEYVERINIPRLRKALAVQHDPGGFSSLVLGMMKDSMDFPLEDDRGVEKVYSRDDLLRRAVNVSKHLTALCCARNDAFVLVPGDARMRALSEYSLCHAALKDLNSKNEKIKEYFTVCSQKDDRLRELFERWSGLHRISKNSLPRVTVCGLLNTGKSSLLNMLTDNFEEEQFPTANRRETASVAEYEHENICYVDTPGLDADAQDEKRSWDAFLSADAILFVHTLRGELIERELEILKRLKNERRDISSSMLVVLTWLEDCVEEPTKISHLKSKISMQIKSLFDECPPIVPVSNKMYQKGKIDGKNNLCARSGMHDLKKCISDIIERMGDIEKKRQEERKRIQKKMQDRLSVVFEQIITRIDSAWEDDKRSYEKLVKQFESIQRTWRTELRHYDSIE